MDQTISKVTASSLAWYPELGWGRFDVTAGVGVYDKAYFERYQAMAATPMGKAITDYRVGFVNRHTCGEVYDYGAGAAAFVAARGVRTWGWDINPHARERLDAMGKLIVPSSGTRFGSVSMFDVLEHLHDPAAVLAMADRRVFLSIPIFRGPEHVTASKHYRKTEHVWYFTRPGLVEFMGLHGFALETAEDGETKLGREDIGTFTFRRVKR